jgi:hypothetical protein
LLIDTPPCCFGYEHNPSGRAADAISAWAPFAVSSERLSRLAVAPCSPAAFPSPGHALIVASAAARFSDHGFWLCPRRSSRRAGALPTSHPAGLYPDHCPAFGTGEPQGGRHHSVKTGQSGPTPNNGDAPLDQCGRATAWAPRAKSVEPIMRPASLLCPLVQRLA